LKLLLQAVVVVREKLVAIDTVVVEDPVVILQN